MSKCNYGAGLNFAPVRPKDYPLSGGGSASGVVSFMNVFDAWIETIKSGGEGRRGALISLLPVWHVDIFEYIDAKRQPGKLTNFNISVGITEEFIRAVKADDWFQLKWNGVVQKEVKAKDIWNKLVESGFTNNDPGLFMLDEVNKYNNLYYLYELDSVNPCGEIPLPSGNPDKDGIAKTAGGVCDLGNANVTKMIIEPFADYTNWRENFDWGKFDTVIRYAVRFLDNVLDVSDYPYEDLGASAKRDRRIGLNVLAGIGSALAMLKVEYGSKLSIDIVSEIQKAGTIIAYDESCNLAIEKGSFESFDAELFCAANFIKKLPQELQDKIRKTGIRNCSLMTIPPVGTGSILAGNISSGIEPIFSLQYDRKVRQADDTFIVESVEDYAWRLWKKMFPLHALSTDLNGNIFIPDYFKTSMQISPYAHIDVQAAAQYWIDGSISKTINCSEDTTLEEYNKILWYAIDKGIKGITTYVAGTREAILTDTTTPKVEINPVEVISKASVPVSKRPRKLKGETYQIPEGDGNHTYCTINSHNNKPWEIFFNASGENYEWFAAIGRLASRLMRKTNDVQAVIDELKQIKGNGFLTQEFGYVESKPMLVGLLLEEFNNDMTGTKKEIIGSKCPECGQMTLIAEGGCKHCTSCGYDKCGS
jgi:ribonucleoside-diphosphate reductase alpha chain